jgi:hypothetical protein
VVAAVSRAVRMCMLLVVQVDGFNWPSKTCDGGVRIRGETRVRGYVEGAAGKANNVDPKYVVIYAREVDSKRVTAASAEGA